MIINKQTKEWQMFSYTSENVSPWASEEIWNISDNSELAFKVIASGPKWEAVVDSEGNLVDCIPDVSPLVENARDLFRGFRKAQFTAFDIYKSNVEYGIEVEDELRRTEILSWYNTMLDFPDQINENNYITITYPVTPECIRKYL